MQEIAILHYYTRHTWRPNPFDSSRDQSTTGYLFVAFQPINCVGYVVKKLNNLDFLSIL